MSLSAHADIIEQNHALLILLKLTKNNLTESKKRNIHGFAEGGQFEVLIKPEAIPVGTTKCPKEVILRMPWTDPDTPDAIAEITDKKVLYDDFVKLRAGQLSSVEVVVNVRPYGQVVTTKPLKVELYQCNAFFFSSDGHVLRQLHPAALDFQRQR